MSEQELMGELASLLKTLRVGKGNSNPQLSAVRLARVLNQDKAVLIDGGATHCLRNPHSREEYLNHAEEVRVDLAARYGYGDFVLGRSKPTADSSSR